MVICTLKGIEQALLIHCCLSPKGRSASRPTQLFVPSVVIDVLFQAGTTVPVIVPQPTLYYAACIRVGEAHGIQHPDRLP